MHPVLPRPTLLNLFKAVAAQIIVLHHLAFYGPLSDVLHGHWPDPVEWLYDYGRMAVQVFLVIAGFLAAVKFDPARSAPPAVLGNLLQRYVRLALPAMAALLLALSCAAIARLWMQHESIPAAATLPQLVANALLLQDLLDQPALTAGIWYLAIDLQLFALMLIASRATYGLSRNPERRRRLMWAMVGLLGASSLLYFNRDARFDDWGLYFFGAYALGALARWAAATRHLLASAAPLLIAGLALLVEPRERILVAGTVASLLALAHQAPDWLSAPSAARWIDAFGQASFALFLVHFPLALMVNAFTHAHWPGQLLPASMGLLAIWLLANVAAFAFHTGIEQPLQRLGRR